MHLMVLAMGDDRPLLETSRCDACGVTACSITARVLIGHLCSRCFAFRCYGNTTPPGILNSNMMQSLMPEVDHGNQIKDLFCRETSLPHCVGGVPAAEHALNYANDFLKVKEYRGVPKAAFVHLTDGHEDTLTMIRSVDAQIASFVESHSNKPADGGRGTTVVVLSDHGLHYGSYFSTPSGQLEHQSPLL